MGNSIERSKIFKLMKDKIEYLEFFYQSIKDFFPGDGEDDKAIYSAVCDRFEKMLSKKPPQKYDVRIL